MSFSSPANLDEVISALNLREQQPSKRYMSIKRNDSYTMVCINIMQAYPLLSIPKNVFRDNIIMDAPHTIKDPNNGFNGTILEGVEFDEFFLQPECKPNITTALYDELKRTRRTHSVNIDFGTRYKPILTVTNPINKTKYVFLIDGLYGDIILVPGLDYLLDQDISFKNNLDVLQIKGYVITRDLPTVNKDRTFSITTPITEQKGFCTIPDIKGDMELPNARAYLIPCNRDVYYVANNNIMPIIYDKYQIKTNQEVQLAKYPMLIVELGVNTDLINNDPDLDKLRNFALYMDNLNMLSYIRNDSYKATTTFGIALPCV